MKIKIVIIVCVITLTSGVSFWFYQNISDKNDKVVELLEDKNLNDDNLDVNDDVEILEFDEKEEKEDDKTKEELNSDKEVTPTDKKDTTKEEEKKTTEVEDKKDNPQEEPKKIVKTENVDEASDEVKYGVKITTTTTYKVTTYSDGTTTKDKINSKTTYEKSTFNATTSELKSEATSLASKNKSIYEEVLKYVNGYRDELSVAHLALDDNLSVAATLRALEMAWSGKFDHERPNGSDCFTVYNELGYSTNAKGENIAYGYTTAAAVANGWYNSPGHKENMQRDTFGKIGIGMAEIDGAKYWVQLFAS